MYLYPHKNEWKDDYASESSLIFSSYGEGIKLQHIGSTAVDGLFAKDCIDILGVVEDLSEVTRRKNSMIELGYQYKGEYGLSGREYFTKNVRKVHLHIFQEGDHNIQKHRYFVDVMRNNNQLVEELNKLKLHLHQKYPSDKDSYQREKEHFYKQFGATQSGGIYERNYNVEHN